MTVTMTCTSFRLNSHCIVCQNVKELLAWSRRHIWSLSDSNEIWTHNHLVCKRTLNHLAKLDKLLNLGWVSKFQLSWVMDWEWRVESDELSLEWLRSEPFRQTIECGFTLKLVHDMIITYSQMGCADKNSKHSSTIWPEWPGCSFTR